ncbi:MAG: PD40 domain-containing protein [Chlorobi bacterium]|nr:MAG: periplasmic protease [Chlorobi bacterium OLB7]MBK8910175.1 PD40 domain-containing protein [Chlorobiota bacterium]MBX7217884.1 PDZ domain-containing protein [Candidatus Kapabacteria bacterium]
MASSGYYRYPTIHHETVIFISEDDLWSVPASGGIARRLTTSVSEVARPILSPDGQWIAFMARDEGPYELYVMPSVGGEAKRLTWLGSVARPVAWTPDSSRIIFVTNHGQPFPHTMLPYSISPNGGEFQLLPVGPAHNVAFGPNGGMVIGRNTTDPARWKRYRGGTAGELWIDPNGNGEFHKLLTLRSNYASPMWIGNRIYFVSDHEGYGNIYSCTTDGQDLTRHTDHDDFFARNPSTDGQRIVYHAGGDLYLFDPATEQSNKLQIDYHSPRSQRQRRFVNGGDYLQYYSLHPKGHSVALVLRGKPVTMGNEAGAVQYYGIEDGVRYRLAAYLHDGKRLVATSDASGEERLVILDGNSQQPEERLEDLDIGHAIELLPSPNNDHVAITNNRNEVLLVDLQSRELKVIDRSTTLHDTSIAWSPDGQWLAFNHADDTETSFLMIANITTGEKHQVTEPTLQDVAPSFDPEGKYLYFLSYREYDPVYDNLHFDLSFPRGVRPYLLTLQKETANPFIKQPKAPKSMKDMMEKFSEAGKHQQAEEEAAKGITIDFDGITRRILPFPVPEGRYSQVKGAKGKVFFVNHQPQGSLSRNIYAESAPSGVLDCYDFETMKTENYASGVSEIELLPETDTLIYRSGKRLRVISTNNRPDPSKESGDNSEWIDLNRPKVSVTPSEEWRQMYREAWRLQRDYFWTEGLLGLNWPNIYTLYLPLLEKISTRSEFSDVIWELHGELGTSHAYEMGGDYRPSPHYAQGFLGADLAWDESAGVWRVQRVVRGDCWSDRFGSPLDRAGVNIAEGDAIVAMNGKRLTKDHGPAVHLVNMANTDVTITYRSGSLDEEKTVQITTMMSEGRARYREWVNENRRKVHAATNGRVGYVHIPDMGPFGYSEFHRGFLAESSREALVVDVRFNGGGHVSQLILEKLARKTIGYSLPRYGLPSPYPSNSVRGPMVALTNENAGSDGDIFSHCFKLMKLGPLIGKRTWGGVVGIWPRNPMVDGSVTTQPEFSTWFTDVQWGVENYGTDPDIEIDITPQDHAAGRDTQLERGIAEVLRLLDEHPTNQPEFGDRPTLAPAPLPKRHINGKVSS